MSEKLGWYEMRSNKDGLTFCIFSKKLNEDKKYDDYYPTITIEFLEADYAEGEWFAESMNINNPAIEEINELTLEILKFLQHDPGTVNQMINILDNFLWDKQPEMKRAPLD